jgi:glycosyltransferase involved in cell wall biosynthesis
VAGRSPIGARYTCLIGLAPVPMTPDLSIVIPIRNESPNIQPLYAELTAALLPGGRAFEVIIIDDGSTDDSFTQLAALQAVDPRLRVIRFRRNFGQTAAFAAGFAYARGRLVVTSDGDLQNDPHDIERMARMADDEGYDIVCGWRKDRKDTFVTRRVPSMIANWIISKATGVALHDYGCSLKVFRAEIVKGLRLYGEMHRFLPAIASEQGVRIAEVVVNHRARRAGTSKYGLSRTIRVVLVRLVLHQPIADRPLLLLGVLLAFTGVQFLTFGLLAELMARTYYESQSKPTYVIREVRQSEGQPAAVR